MRLYLARARELKGVVGGCYRRLALLETLDTGTTRTFQASRGLTCVVSGYLVNFAVFALCSCFSASLRAHFLTIRSIIKYFLDGIGFYHIFDNGDGSGSSEVAGQQHGNQLQLSRQQPPALRLVQCSDWYKEHPDAVPPTPIRETRSCQQRGWLVLQRLLCWH